MKGTELMSLRNHRSYGVNSLQAEPQSARQCFLLCKREERTRGAEPEMNRNGEEEMEGTYASQTARSYLSNGSIFVW